MNPQHSIEIGVLIERRPLRSPWQDHGWVPVELVPGGLPATPWTVLREAAGTTRYFANNVTLRCFRSDTEGYRRNLSSAVPIVYVVLRRVPGPFEVQIFLATANPYEAQCYMMAGEDIVEGVAMPAEVEAALAAFVERHHADQPFVKRGLRPRQAMLGKRGDGR